MLLSASDSLYRNLEDTTLKNLSVWIKPAIAVTTINKAAYYSVSSSDEGGAEHRS